MSLVWDVNYIAVVVAAVAGMVIGAVYFMPAVAGNAWMKALGKTPDDFKGANQPVLYAMAAVFTLLMATTLAAVIGWADAHTLVNGALAGFLMWLGFSLPVIGLTFMFELRPMANHIITGLDYLITFVVMGAIIGAWPVAAV
ncbi:MAG: DUF1761 domain-containing protein [Alphaproteobacteria bacterium]|jgi:hypothetical protein|nr:DUF1761 domain-containing protein [Alphaproteobacteria bacterium]MBT4710349.1 DUF1761 domain-containing protein [Alphaproteobacteria bacterium]